MARWPQARGFGWWTVERRMRSDMASEFVAGEGCRQQEVKKGLSVSKIASEFGTK
jgi:hypothetical protein